jgi:lactate dehydrogenase-like 2-hydroxyacid dehydrogenase
LLRASEVLSLHAPETEETHHFITSKTIELLPHGAIVINTARGGLVMDEGLITALKSAELQQLGWTSSNVNRRSTPDMLRLRIRFCFHISEAPP